MTCFLENMNILQLWRMYTGNIRVSAPLKFMRAELQKSIPCKVTNTPQYIVYNIEMNSWSCVYADTNSFLPLHNFIF